MDLVLVSNEVKMDWARDSDLPCLARWARLENVADVFRDDQGGE
jgi:hypothetical protein